MRPWRNYRISARFEVPLDFAFRWCTDYRPDDGKYGGEDRSIGLRRRIVQRNAHRVVFENLYDVGEGWGWERHVVTLDPPNRWHCVGKGNHDESVLDYELTALSVGRTRFRMRWKSRPVGLPEGPRPPRHQVESYVAGLWRDRARAMEREYREQMRRRPERPSLRNRTRKPVE